MRTYIYMNDDSALHTYRIYFWTGNEGKIQLKSIVVAFCCLFNVFTFYLVSRNGFPPFSLFRHPIISYYSLHSFFHVPVGLCLHRLLNSIWSVGMEMSTRGFEKKRVGNEPKMTNKRMNVENYVEWNTFVVCISLCIDWSRDFIQIWWQKSAEKWKVPLTLSQNSPGTLMTAYWPTIHANARTHVWIIVVHAQWWPALHKRAKKKLFLDFLDLNMAPTFDAK